MLFFPLTACLLLLRFLSIGQKLPACDRGQAEKERERGEKLETNEK